MISTTTEPSANNLRAIWFRCWLWLVAWNLALSSCVELTPRRETDGDESAMNLRGRHRPWSLLTQVPSTTSLVMRYAGGHGQESEHTLRRTQSFQRPLARDCRVPRALLTPVSSLPELPLPGTLQESAFQQVQEADKLRRRRSRRADERQPKAGAC